MASRRDLKKDVNHILCEIVDQCYSQLYYSPEINQESIVNIISDAELLRKNLIHKICNTYHIERSKRKSYYHDLLNELYDKSIEFVERLNTIKYE